MKARRISCKQNPEGISYATASSEAVQRKHESIHREFDIFCASLCFSGKVYNIQNWMKTRRMNSSSKSIVMINASTGKPEDKQTVPLLQNTVFFRAECDFTNKKDMANFFYSLDGKIWISIGTPLKMSYTIPHFMGYRFGLFNYATKEKGGYADFDYFRIADKISNGE